MNKIDRTSLIGEIIRENPELEMTFTENGMMCIGCPSAQMETVEQACLVHGLNTEKLLNALNEKLAN